MLGQRLRRWPNIKPTLVEGVVRAILGELGTWRWQGHTPGPYRPELHPRAAPPGPPVTSATGIRPHGGCCAIPRPAVRPRGSDPRRPLVHGPRFPRLISACHLCPSNSLFVCAPQQSKHQPLPMNTLGLWPTSYLIVIFTHLKLCFADAIHNFKWLKIIQIWIIE